MTGVLLDTNVISELTRPKPAPPVIAFLAAQEDLWLSTLVLHELEIGVLLLPPGGRREVLRGVLSELLRRYEDRVIAVDTEVATWAAKFRVDARRCGRTLDLGDALICGDGQGARPGGGDAQRDGLPRARRCGHKPVGLRLMDWREGRRDDRPWTSRV